MRRWCACVALAVAVACTPRVRTDDAPPTLERLSPDSVQVRPGAVVEVTVVGAGFRASDPGENTVHFGTSALRKVRASGAGTRIVFAVPDAMTSGGEAPPVNIVPGTYPVRVETPAGTSNTLMLKVYR